MASMLCARVISAVRRPLLVTAVRCGGSGGPVVDPMKGKVVSDNVTMPDTLGHSVGAERYELLAKLAGNEDPFEMNVKMRGAGSKEEPNLVPSIYEKRLVGCICEEDATCINWMHLYKGEPKRCECGHWFQLSELKSVDYTQQ
ncbi:cytochrome c oxidase subunit 5B, mitochondrial-like [Tubulanus polymorphus]|uniref:cytochrome c oxidase subunit 5B, mitochondrial-like n=1 Tax=Tubulanus polymorphus TaxID=672921 RepID=UPI003DA4285F